MTEASRRPAASPEEQITCRSCGGSFGADELAGSYLDRRCPLCGEGLSEDGYDADAARLLEQRTSLAASEARLKARADQARSDLQALRLWQRPFRHLWQSRADEADAELKECRRSFHAVCAELKRLPACRYHVSEWYQLTRIPLQNSDPARGPRYRLDALYADAGSFRLLGKDVAASGFEGEHDAFESLRRRARDPGSPLHGARLLPNLYVPCDGGSRDGRWRQVDCAVATRKCLFVLEVKRWNARISATPDFRMLFAERKGENSGVYAPADQVMAQLGETASALGRLSPYPAQRVFRLAVFVRPTSFECGSDSFVGRTLVSWSDRDNAPFADAMERQLEGLDDLLGERGVVRWSEELLLAYGDRDGERRALAERKRAEAASIAATPAHARGAVRARDPPWRTRPRRDARAGRGRNAGGAPGASRSRTNGGGTSMKRTNADNWRWDGNAI